MEVMLKVAHGHPTAVATGVTRLEVLKLYRICNDDNGFMTRTKTLWTQECLELWVEPKVSPPIMPC